MKVAHQLLQTFMQLNVKTNTITVCLNPAKPTLSFYNWLHQTTEAHKSVKKPMWKKNSPKDLWEK